MSTITPVLTHKSTMSNTDLDRFEVEFDNLLTRLEPILGECSSLLQETKGKRLRPMLVFMTCTLFRPPGKRAMKAALTAELIHLASLIHDDIIDDSLIRRGKPSINALYGNHAAVLAGDALFAEAFRLLAEPSLLPAMNSFVLAIQLMCTGEIEQGLNRFNTERSIDSYLSHINKKTGSLIEASCQAGAMVGGARPEDVEALRSFGFYIGQAFQIADDLLDFLGQEQKLGKPVHHDLGEGEFTLPVLYLLHDPLYGHSFINKLQVEAYSEDFAKELDEALRQSGALSRSLFLAESYVDKACGILQEFPSSIARDSLLSISQAILKRLPSL